MSGKGFFSQLLDGHKNTAVFPYHKFGISCVYKDFEYFVTQKKHFFDKLYFEEDNNIQFKLKFNENDEIYKLCTSQLLYFLIKFNASFSHLIHSNETKKVIAFAGDKHFVKHNFNFDLLVFIKHLKNLILKNDIKILNCESLDNCIFKAFILSTKEYNIDSNKISHYIQWSSQLIEEIDYLHKYYKDFRCIYIKRDLLSAAYSIALRNHLKKYDENTPLNKTKIKRLMIIASYKRLSKENLIIQKLKKYLNISENFLIIEFNNLFIDRKLTMKKVSNFLGLDYDDSLLAPHLINSPINEPFFNKDNMNDDPSELFTKNELKNISKHFNSYYKFKLNTLLLKLNI